MIPELEFNISNTLAFDIEHSTSATLIAPHLKCHLQLPLHLIHVRSKDHCTILDSVTKVIADVIHNPKAVQSIHISDHL